jgi:hypothetical protein
MHIRVPSLLSASHASKSCEWGPLPDTPRRSTSASSSAADAIPECKVYYIPPPPRTRPADVREEARRERIRDLFAYSGTLPRTPAGEVAFSCFKEQLRCELHPDNLTLKRGGRYVCAKHPLPTDDAEEE